MAMALLRVKGLSSSSSTFDHPHKPQPMQYLPWLAAALTVGICGLPLQAMASSRDLPTTPVSMADIVGGEQHSQDRLDRLARDMGRQVGRQDDNNSNNLAQSLDIPLLNDLLGDLLDESGELKLPLGLTVYDAMGTTSIGFGSRF